MSEKQRKIEVFSFFSETPPILWKDSANGEKQRKIEVFSFFSETPPILETLAYFMNNYNKYD
ncbi:MAG: hypothetical protein IKT00_05905 [Prevotella sp.]|nr:hypothetical protein [Prevotella sp.]